MPLIVYQKILVDQYYMVSSGKEAFLKLLGETEVAEQVYNSNAIENSTLTLEEIVGKTLTNSYHKRITYLEGAPIITLAEYAKEKKIMPAIIKFQAFRTTPAKPS